MNEVPKSIFKAVLSFSRPVQSFSAKKNEIWSTLTAFGKLATKKSPKRTYFWQALAVQTPKPNTVYWYTGYDSLKILLTLVGSKYCF